MDLVDSLLSVCFVVVNWWQCELITHMTLNSDLVNRKIGDEESLCFPFFVIIYGVNNFKASDV